MRRALISRRTAETAITLRLGIEGRGRYAISTGIRFLDHMLELVARHGAFDLRIDAVGDLDVDQHHTVEDVGIGLGEAVAKAIGSRRGINRAGYFVMPMDETLGVAAIDLGGRPHAVVDLRLRVQRVGDLQSELIQDFFEGFAQGVLIHQRAARDVDQMCTPLELAKRFAVHDVAGRRRRRRPFAERRPRQSRRDGG